MVFSLKALMLYLEWTNRVIKHIGLMDRATKSIKLMTDIGKRLEYVVESITTYWHRSSRSP
jgi:hypothetical protein